MNDRQPAQPAFGDWLRERRRALDLTQQELARLVGCSVVMLRKLEAETRRPSKQIADRLAEALQIAPNDRANFLRFARGDPFARPDAAAAPLALERRAAAPPHNLPNPLNSFVGREAEMMAVAPLILATRLVTLTGPGGTGKTRLALQVARELLEHFADGVWLVELAPLADPALIPQTVMSIFGLKEEAIQPIRDTLTHFLRERHLLLVLDSCEHLVEACADLAESWLQTCPRVRILATSRENLSVPGERVYYVPALALPAANAALGVEALSDCESVRLFVERAAVVAPRFAVTSQNAAAVVQVCQRVEGLPLAIELAAARLRLLSIEEIALRLDDAFRLLTGGSRTGLPRHQTLQALFDWSYELLSTAEQTLWRRLAVFQRGWTLEAAEAVVAGNGLQRAEVLDLLERLVDKSLVLVDDHAQLRRYHLLETVRRYGLARLGDSGEADTVWQRQGAYYWGLIKANEAEHPTTLPVRSGGLPNLELEQDNLRAVLAWCQANPNGAHLGLRLASALDWFWFSRGLWSEAQGWLEGALKHPDAAHFPRALAQALESLGTILVLRGDYEAGQAQLARSLRLFQELKDRPMMAWLLNRQGWAAREGGDTSTARQRLEESLALYRELPDEVGMAWSALTLGDIAETAEEAAQATLLLQEALSVFEKRGVRLGAAWAHNHLGHAALLLGDYARATQEHAASRPRFQELGESLGLAWAQQGLGETALAAGDMGQAAAHFAAGADLFRSLGDRAGLAWCLAGQAGATAASQPSEAAWLWGAAEALRQSIGARPAPMSSAIHSQLMARARAQLGQTTFDKYWAEGQAAAPEQAGVQPRRTRP